MGMQPPIGELYLSRKSAVSLSEPPLSKTTKSTIEDVALEESASLSPTSLKDPMRSGNVSPASFAEIDSESEPIRDPQQLSALGGENLTETLEHIDSFEVPSVFGNQGLLLLKVSHKSKKKIRLWIDSANFRFVYQQVSKSTSHTFDIDDIRSVTPRELGSHYREELGISKEFEKRWLSISFFDHRKNKRKYLHLIADTSYDAKRLLYTVANFKNIKDKIANTFLVDLKDLDEVKKSIISGKAEYSDKNPKQFLTFAEVLKYCKRLSINVKQEKLHELFSQVSSSDENKIDFDKFKKFVVLLTKRNDIQSIWSSVVNGSYMTLEEFSKFALHVQKETWDSDLVMKIYKKFALVQAGISEESFAAYLKSEYCRSSHQVFSHREYFSHPLNEYFILSSHNTYLMGRQVVGDSSVEGYVKALQRGCRCLEIDIWNNPEDVALEPIVNHGRTFTNGISLSNVLVTIKKFAFCTTHYPLILSLEVHCSSHGQNLIVDILQKTFGHALVLCPIDENMALPSPTELKDRILIKVKKTSAIFDDNGNFVTSSTTPSLSESNESSGGAAKFKIRRRPSSKINDKLSELGIYCQGLKFRNFSLPESKTYNHCFSLSEKTASAMLRETQKREALDKHNRKYFMRVYPSKIRLMSSNFNPITYWEHGVQMVATNWQTYDLGQQLNEAFFDIVQGKGYVLKPPDLRSPILKSGPSPWLKKDVITRFQIEIISAQQLPKLPPADFINPFITIELVGIRSLDWDASSSIGATKVVAENGFNPHWGQVFSGKFSSSSDFVFLRLTIHTSASTNTVDSPKEICLSVSRFFDLKQGYRHLPLKDLCGETLVYSTVFVNISYERE